MLYAVNPQKSVCGDICKLLVELWKEIRDHPEALADGDLLRWTKLQKEGYMVYYAIREEFNKSKSPYDLLFLSWYNNGKEYRYLI